MPEELKPCPFCGKLPVTQNVGEGNVEIICKNYSCSIMPFQIYETEQEAIEAWNTRGGEICH